MFRKLRSCTRSFSVNRQSVKTGGIRAHIQYAGQRFRRSTHLMVSSSNDNYLKGLASGSDQKRNIENQRQHVCLKEKRREFCCLNETILSCGGNIGPKVPHCSLLTCLHISQIELLHLYLRESNDFMKTTVNVYAVLMTGGGMGGMSMDRMGSSLDRMAAMSGMDMNRSFSGYGQMGGGLSDRVSGSKAGCQIFVRNVSLPLNTFVTLPPYGRGGGFAHRNTGVTYTLPAQLTTSHIMARSKKTPFDNCFFFNGYLIN